MTEYEYSPLDKALRQFEATEANLEKLERLLKEITDMIPEGVVFGEDPIYEDHCLTYESILNSLPKIDGWKPDELPRALNEIARNRMDVLETGEIEFQVSIEE